MSLKDEIIFVLLNTTDYISGEELAKKFGKSRAAVWKSIKKLISLSLIHISEPTRRP